MVCLVNCTGQLDQLDKLLIDGKLNEATVRAGLFQQRQGSVDGL